MALENKSDGMSQGKIPLERMRRETELEPEKSPLEKAVMEAQVKALIDGWFEYKKEILKKDRDDE